MKTTVAHYRRLCKRTGQPIPPELNQPPKQRAVKIEGGTDLERAFDTAWQRFGLAGVTWEREYRFCENRRWRIDRALPALRIAVEIEGNGHNKYVNFKNDMHKYNALSGNDYLLFRCTAGMLGNDPAGFIALVVQAIERRQKEKEEGTL